MSNYDYNYEMLRDVRGAVANYCLDEWRGRRDELEEQMNEDLWTDDSVTGNASGSYFFGSWAAREAVCSNMELLQEALDEFGADYDDIGRKFLAGDWEGFDVTIRCHLLPSIISEVLDEVEAGGDLDELEDEADA